MSKFITIVIEYQDGDEQPRFHANMEVLGGKVVAFQFDDALADEEEGE